MLAKLDFPDAELYLQGAHLTRFKDWLYLSSRSNFAEGKPIRGGIPVVFPWFGPKRDDADAPQHGWARTSVWNVEEQSPEGITLSLRRADLSIRLGYKFGDTLGVNVRIENLSSEFQLFEVALHTYFAISTISAVEIEGLNGLTYIDKPSGNQRLTQSGPVRFDGEVDRIYLDAPSPLRIHDGKQGFELQGDWKSAVTWNPGQDKAAAMKDVGEGEWQKYVCLEVGAIADNAINLEPQGIWEMNVQISRL